MTAPFDHLTVLIDAEHLQQGVKAMAAQINTDLAPLSPEEEPILVVVLKGGAVFGMDLLKALRRPMPVVFIAARSVDPDFLVAQEDKALLRGHHILVADALMDSGGSLKRLHRWLQSFNPLSIRLAVLLHKTVCHAEPLVINYLGYEVPDVRLVGYGLDEEQRFRGLPAVYTWWQKPPEVHDPPSTS